VNAKEYRDIGEKQGTGPVPMPKPKPDMTQPLQNLRGVESVPTSKDPQRKTLPPEQ
jgi:hypothetical protein